jgi:hypothetical protein
MKPFASVVGAGSVALGIDSEAGGAPVCEHCPLVIVYEPPFWQ